FPDYTSPKHYSSSTSNLYPMPQTVTIILAAPFETLDNFSRNRLTCVSTVRRSPKNSYCHTSFNRSSLLYTLSGDCAKNNKSSYSLGVRATSSSLEETRYASKSIVK